jgi:cytochrome c5
MMKRTSMAMTIAMVEAIAGSGTTSATAPPITPPMIRTGARQHVDAASLTSGRSLFLNRCAHCHMLPAVGKESPENWPRIVAKMSKRSGLKPEQSKSVLGYILAAQATAVH